MNLTDKPEYLIIPDCQVKDGVPLDHLDWIGQYIVDKEPNVILNLGDFGDMPSLSTYDQGKKSFEGRRYTKDIQAVHEANDRLFGPLEKAQVAQRRNKQKVYKPEKHILYGNHEIRINRAVENDAKLEGLISLDDLEYANYYDHVHDFLETVVLGGIVFSHYFVTGTAGRAASTAQAQLNKTHMSCIAGHQQGLKIATSNRGDGASITSIIAGSCYLHDEEYMGKQGNKHWRGILRLLEVEDGCFDLMPVSLNYLQKEYA